MQKKITAIILAAIMLISMLTLSACKEELDEESGPPIVLTPKEKMMKTPDAVKSLFSELNKGMGIENYTAEPTEGKTAVTSLGMTIKEFTIMDSPYFEEPVGFSMNFYGDEANNSYKGYMELFVGDSSLPAELILSSEALYVVAESLIEDIIKIPVEGMTELLDVIKSISGEELAVSLREYIDIFTDNLDDELFTEETGTVTIDGVEITDAESITFKATEKQLAEALLAVLNKAKTDVKIKRIISNFAFGESEKDELIGEFEDALDETIESLEEVIEENEEGNYITLVTVTQNGAIRSLELTMYDEGEESLLITVTSVEKDGTQYLKGEVSEEKETVFEFSYEQTPNQNGSADGRAVLTAYQPQIEMTSTTIFELEGSKSGNQTTIQIDIESTTEYEDDEELYGTSVVGVLGQEISMLIKYEYASAEDISCSVEVTMGDEDVKLVLEFTSGYKLRDYEEIAIPNEEDTVEVDENFDATTLIMSLQENYPEIFDFIMSLSETGGGMIEFQTFYTEDYENVLTLLSNGTGTVSAALNNVSYGDGEYSAELFDGTVITGTYTQGEDTVTIDGNEYFYVEEYEGLPDIFDAEYSFVISFFSEDYCNLSCDFVYWIADDTLYLQFANGGEMELDIVDNGDYITVNGIDFIMSVV